MGRKRKYNTEEERKAARRVTVKRYNDKNKERYKKWCEDHKEELAAKNKQYRDEHKAEIAAKKKRYREKHKAEIAAHLKQWREEHKEERTTYDKQYYSSIFGRAVNLAGTYRQYDTKYNRGECTIDAQWIVENVFSGQVCHYCGESD